VNSKRGAKLQQTRILWLGNGVSVQVFDQTMFPNFPGYNRMDEIMTRFNDGRKVVITPNVRRAVHQHFNCSRMYGAELEDDGGRGTAESHWEQRIFEVHSLATMMFSL
jgi:hypothetical protein